MPIYEYACRACGHHFDVFAKMSDAPPAACENCGSAEIGKVLSAPAIHYKGSGFYSTDYAAKKTGSTSSSSDAGSSSSSDSASSGTSSGSSSSDGGSSSAATSAGSSSAD